MKLKNKLILLGISIGVMSCFGINNSQATEITSVFSGETISRQTVANLSTVSELDNSIVPITLGISKSDYKTNDGDGRYFYWTIKDSNGQYKDLYCLNLERGFGAPDGNITNSNSTKSYTNEYNLNTITSQNYTNYTGLSTTNKNKVLWILNNSLTSKENINTILKAASKKVDGDSVGLPGITSFVKEDMISNTRNSTKLTFNDVKMIQQIAIWHYTNPGSIFDNTISSICDSEGNQISALRQEDVLIDTDTYSTTVRNGLIKQAKINALYQYFIDGAESATSEIKTPTLSLSNTNAKVTESGDNYIVGPFSLSGTNTELIKSITANVNVDYTLLNSSKAAVSGNDFTKVIGSNFYLKISKNKITESTNININLTYKYDQKEITLLTNASDPTNTQPVVFIQSKESGISINTNSEIKLATVTVFKTWEDNNNQDGKRPQSIKVQLFEDGVKKGTPVTLTEANVFEADPSQWVYNWEKLLAGKEYTVKEIDKLGNILDAEDEYDENYKLSKYEYYYMPEGWEVPYGKTPENHVNGIINTYIPETINISGTKTWEDNNDQDGKRPQSITINLLANGEKVNSKKVSSPWTYSFTNLPKYQSGKEIKYTITEDKVEGYTETISGYNITNKYMPETINISGTKIWEDNNNQDGKRPQSITVNLLANGTKIKDITVTSSNNWKYSFTDLPKYQSGKEIIYKITEDKVEGYTATISGYNITNKYIPETINISGTKTWEDNDNQDGIRPDSITVNLLANGTKIKDVTVTASNNWKYSFTDLPKYQAGKEIKYTITEDKVEGYTETISGYNITNKYTPSKVSKTVIKEWADGNDSDGIRPDKITVELYKIVNGQEVTIDTRELYEANNWTYTWNNLDEKTNGEKIVYGIKEIGTIDGYTINYSAKDYSNTDTITITNTHVSKDLAIQIQKVDEQGNIITSSEAEFEIAGAQTLTDETNQGKLDLNSQKLRNSFEYTYTIKESKSPVGYNGVSEELSVKISGTAKSENGSYIMDAIDFTDKDGNPLDNTKISAEYNEELNKAVIKIVNTKITNEYLVKLLKVGEDGTTAIEGAWFKVNDNSQPIQVSKDGNEITSGTLSDDSELNLLYKLEETTAPTGYIKIDGQKEVKIKAKVELQDNTYQITQVNLEEDIEGISISEDNNVITIKVKNEPNITGKYNVVLRKVDENGNILTGSKFKVSGTEYDLSTGEVIIYENQQITSDAVIDFMYMIEEIVVPVGYNGIEATEVNIKAQVQKVDNNYKLIRATLVDSEGNNITDDNISIKLEGDSIVIEVKNIPIEKEFDLALRKFITKINDETYSREPLVDTSTIETTGTATYRHSKQPIAVQKGDIVTYTIRVYNEGETDGYVDKITDYLPEYLLPIIIGTEGIDEEKYADEIEFNLNWGWIVSGDGKTVTTMKTAKVNSDTYSMIEGYENITDTKLEAYVEGSDKLDYIDVQIKCLVTDSAAGGEYITNIAEITDAQDINGNKGDGFDSELDNVDHSNLSDYKNNESINSTTESYVPGQEDDDDFEKLVVKEFDLALRKFITKVNETIHSREPGVDTSKLGTIVNGKTITTATYIHTKEPVIVETSDLVTYKIRIYNEGTIAGFANEITDDIPEGLEFLPNSDINVSYRWKMIDKDGKETEDVAEAVMIITDYLSDRDSNNIIKEVTEANGEKTLSYKDVEVQFKVIAKAEKLEDNIIINEAQISADSDRDIDSIPNRDEKYDYTTEKNEDDIDYEPIKLQYFDLALRKFITKVNSTDYNNRYPEIKFNDDGSITYNHTKDPVLVTTRDTVIYTIRVYNEGEKAGCATEIKDNLPEGLAFDPNNETNKAYGWKMIDKDGNVTEEAEKVVAFKTNYLENEKIDALVEVNGSKVLSYKDVKIAFIVTESNTSDRILVNTAQISKDSDDDVDSTPDNSVESEDDIDKEYVKVEYFDLALKKWVTETRVTLDGKTTTTKTGFTEDSEGIAKVDIVASKLKKTTVKFVYKIKITNEGELPGYAYEVKDYIPSGLKFVPEDNKNWKEVKNNVVVTDQLKDTLLNPGESATVEIVLTWKNSSTNLGLKTNYAEISDDSGDDIDSIPDNYDFTEDDIDDAQVILSIKTAGKTTYIGLVLISITILAGGIFLIKKYVLN